MIRLAPLLAALLTATTGCGGGRQASETGVNAGAALERVAAARGVIAPPGDTRLAGIYSRETDRLCLLPRPDRSFSIGAVVDYGNDLRCVASGRAILSGNALRVELGSRGDCSFDAQVESNVVRFPADLPEGCERFCRGRASLAALTVSQLSGAISEARAMRDPTGKRPCDT